MSIPFMSVELACATINHLVKAKDCNEFINNFRKSLLVNAEDISIQEIEQEIEKVWFTSMQQLFATEWERPDGFTTFLGRLNVADPIVLANTLKKIAEVTQINDVWHQSCSALFDRANSHRDYKTQLELACTNKQWAQDNLEIIKLAVEQSLARIESQPELIEPLQTLFRQLPRLHKETSDVELRSSDHQIVHAHKTLLLTTKSNYIQNALSSLWKKEPSIELPFEAQILITLIEYYEQGVDVSDSTPVNVWRAAHYLQLEAFQTAYEKKVMSNEKMIYPALQAAIITGKREFERRCLCRLSHLDFLDVAEMQMTEIADDLKSIHSGYESGVFFQECELAPTLVITDLVSPKAVEAALFYIKRHQISSLTIGAASCDLMPGDQKLSVQHLSVNASHISKEWLEKNIELQALCRLTITASDASAFPFIEVPVDAVEQLEIQATSLELFGDNFDNFCTYVKKAQKLKEVSLQFIQEATAAEFELLLEAICTNMTLQFLKVQFMPKKFVTILKEKKLQFHQVKESNGARVCTISFLKTPMSSDLRSE